MTQPQNTTEYSHRKDHTLEITAENQPTVLERVLQVTRYRGFSVTAFSVLPDITGTMLEMTLTVNQTNQSSCHDENDIRKLCNQLNKLFDIQQVNFKSMSLGGAEIHSNGFNHSAHTSTNYVNSEFSGLISNLN